LSWQVRPAWDVLASTISRFAVAGDLHGCSLSGRGTEPRMAGHCKDETYSAGSPTF
jgi:hypothetical protein